MNIKAQKFTDFLKANNLNMFQIQEVENEMHPVVYRSAMEVNGQNLPTMLVIDDSIFVMVQVRVGGQLVKDNNKVAVLEHLNKLNEQFKVFKYYVDEEGSIVIESCIPTTDNEFVPDMVHAVIRIILEHLQGANGQPGEFQNIMKTVWGA